MIGHRTLDEVRRFDLFKLAVALLLILLILLSLWRAGLGTSTTGDAGMEGQPLATAELGDAGLGAPPAIVAPTQGGEIVQSGSASQVSGTAAPGSIVQVLIDGAPAGQATADESGVWSLALPLPLGPVALSVQVLDPNGAIVSQSAPVNASVRPPLPPSVNPSSGPAGADDLVMIGGTAEPGSTVTVTVDGQPAGTATAGPDGTWSLPVAMQIGPHQVVAQSSLDGGATVAESIPTTVEVTNPLTLNAGDGFIFDPLTGEYVVTGTAIPGDTVQVVVNGVAIGTTTADEAGNWTLSAEVPAGAAEVVVQTIDPATTAVLNSLPPLAVTIPTEPPSIVMPGLVLPDPLTGAPALSIPAGGLALQGEGAPGTQVAVTVDGQPVGTATVNSAGVWSLDVNVPAGLHQMQLTMLDVDGTQLSSTQPFQFAAVDGPRPSLTAPTAPLVAGPNTLGGTSVPGGAVLLLVNGLSAGQAVAGPDGVWSTEVTLADGPNEIIVQSVGADGAPLLGSVPVNAPVNVDLLEVAAASGEFDILLQAVQVAGLAETLNGQGPFTLFAPTDAAFEALPDGVLDALLANPEALSGLLQGHVVPGQLLSSDVAAADALLTVDGATLAVAVQNGQVFVGNGALGDTDVLSSNGVIHVVEQVLFPTAAGMQPPVIDESGVPTFTGPVLTVVGVAQPEKFILLRVNGQAFGEIATVDGAGNWLVVDNISTGQYVIVAYMLEADGTLLGISKPVNLLVP